MIRKVLKTVCPDIPKKEQMKYSYHSIGVLTYVCLDEAGVYPAFIKNILRWMGGSYRVYLRDIHKINQHNVVLK